MPASAAANLPMPSRALVLEPRAIEPGRHDLAETTELPADTEQSRPEKIHEPRTGGVEESLVQLIERRLHQALPHFFQRVRTPPERSRRPVRQGITAEQECDKQSQARRRIRWRVRWIAPSRRRIAHVSMARNCRQIDKGERKISRERKPQRERRHTQEARSEGLALHAMPDRNRDRRQKEGVRQAVSARGHHKIKNKGIISKTNQERKPEMKAIVMVLHKK